MSFDIHIPKKQRKVLSIDGNDPQFGVAGYWRLVLRNRDGSIARDTGWFKNLITNAGMARIVNQTSWWNFAAIGSGTGTPAFTDTAMFTQLGARVSGAIGNVEGWGAGNAYFYRRYTYRWATGEGTGTIREVGTFTASSGGTMFSHALLVDSGGSPTSIEKMADQSLDVYYELRNYPLASDVVGTFDLSGTSYGYTIRALNIGTASGFARKHNVGTREVVAGSEALPYTGTLAAGTATAPGGSVIGPSWFGTSSNSEVLGSDSGISNVGPYTSDNQWEIDIDAWHGTIRTVVYSSGNSNYQCQYDKTVGGGGIVKTDEDRLRLRLRLTVARH